MNKLISNSILVAFFIAVAAVFPAEALAGFGVSPSNIVHEQLKPGGSFETQITLSRTNPNEALEIIIEPSLDEMKDWFIFEPGMSFMFPKGETTTILSARVNVPADAEFKHFNGVIRVKAKNPAEAVGGVSIVQGARIEVDLVTTDLDIVQLKVMDLNMRDVGEGSPLLLDMKVSNTGNLPAQPWVKMTNMDLMQNDLETLENRDLPFVEANETKEITAPFSSNLKQGEYFSIVEVFHGDQLLRKERLVFRVTEFDPNAIPDQGELAAGPSASELLRRFLLSSDGIILMTMFVVLVVGGYFAIRNYFARKKPSAYKYHYVVFAVYFITLVLVFGIVGRSSFEKFAAGTKDISHDIPAEQDVREEVEEMNEAAQVNVTESPEEPEEATDEGEVQGATSVYEDETKEYEPTVVRGEAGANAYPVYSKQDTSSEVIFWAEEDQTFNVIEETSRWYRISTPDGSDGWLHKTSVKQAD